MAPKNEGAAQERGMQRWPQDKLTTVEGTESCVPKRRKTGGGGGAFSLRNTQAPNRGRVSPQLQRTIEGGSAAVRCQGACRPYRARRMVRVTL